MMDFVFINGFDLFAILAVLVVSVFNHLVPSLVHTSVDLVTIVVVFYLDGLEHASVGLVLYNFVHLPVRIVFVLRVLLVILPMPSVL